MTEHREAEWRQLLAAVRGVYPGTLTYNCDKYGEDHIAWWDAVDVIASSGYYPLQDWPRQLARIGQVAEKFRKHVLFTEQAAWRCMLRRRTEQLGADGRTGQCRAGRMVQGHVRCLPSGSLCTGLRRLGLARRPGRFQPLRRQQPSRCDIIETYYKGMYRK